MEQKYWMSEMLDLLEKLALLLAEVHKGDGSLCVLSPTALSEVHKENRPLCVLKERKKRGEKKKFPPHPLIKEKPPQKIEKETSVCVGDAKEDFRQECLRLVTKDNAQQVADFFYYWSETSKRGTMRFERQKYWNTENRLKRWCKNQYSSEITSAALRLKRLQKKDTANATQQQAAVREREEANERLEREREEWKKKAVSREEWLAMKEKKT